jgi:hypothetical protein
MVIIFEMGFHGQDVALYFPSASKLKIFWKEIALSD